LLFIVPVQVLFIIIKPDSGWFEGKPKLGIDRVELGSIGIFLFLWNWINNQWRGRLEAILCYLTISILSFDLDIKCKKKKLYIRIHWIQLTNNVLTFVGLFIPTSWLSSMIINVYFSFFFFGKCLFPHDHTCTYLFHSQEKGDFFGKWMNTRIAIVLPRWAGIWHKKRKKNV
jgi:hypothetical protein